MTKAKRTIAVVTGGSSGIGYAIAGKLASENFIVANADVAPPKEQQENVHYKECNVSSGDAVDEFFAWVLSEIGNPEILILNAGIGVHERLADGDPELWQIVLNINVMGALRMIRAFVPPMLSNKKGKVIFISSVSSLHTFPYGGVYSASKMALETIAETLRLETLPHICVTIISPGITDTDFFKNEASGSRRMMETTDYLSASHIADNVFHAIIQPEEVCINKMVLRPASQEF